MTKASYHVPYLSRCLMVLAGIIALLVVTSSVTFAKPMANATVRLVHAAAGAGNVDIFIDNTKAISDFSYGSVTKYVSVPAGTHTVKIAPAGKGIGAAIITQTASVAANTIYTAAAVGSQATGFGMQTFIDNNSLNGAAARIRVYHLSPNVGPVSVATGGKTVIPSLSYKSASSYLSLTANSYTFNVTALQTKTTVPVTATLASGMVYSVFAIGLYKGTPALQFVTTAVKGS
ncbi:DUF4397 domain-containing protein [Dictyobacter arantiisoli]|uniref:DUF4397 domain-containing protein n=1 Tax=Dictyobacter arantiisoli TaxID=2014874 RepID=A0A5A5TE50_9CHLR|nr:DUF4397 domain-containing protein [Dictyobacter arantiisoli]GCF09184.1 hypothetical protein KDI_27480 [Dictyobacter arantiisoli]